MESQIIQRRRWWKLLAQRSQPGLQVGDGRIRRRYLSGKAPVAYLSSLHVETVRADVQIAAGTPQGSLAKAVALGNGPKFTSEARAVAQELQQEIAGTLAGTQWIDAGSRRQQLVGP